MDISLKQFKIAKAPSGTYMVTHTSQTGRVHVGFTTDSEIIEKAKKKPTHTNLLALRGVCNQRFK